MSRFVLRVDGGWADNVDCLGYDAEGELCASAYGDDASVDQLVFGTRQEAVDWREVELPEHGVCPLDAWPHQVAA